METGLFVLSKLVGALLRVESWILLLAVLSLLAQMRGRRGAALGLTGALGGFLAVLTFLPLGSVMLHPIEASYRANPPLGQVAGIILLGGAEDVASSVHWGTVELRASAERLTAVAELARRYPKARVLLLGGGGRLRDVAGVTQSEAGLAAAFLQAQGVAGSRLVLEEASRTTAENARLGRRKVQPGAGETWVLVTSAYHMPRAMESFARGGWDKLVPYPVDHRSRAFADGIGIALPENMDLVNIALREWVGRLAYRLTGR